MFSRSKKLDETLDSMSRSLDLLERRAELMQTILTVREPSSVAAGEAYEGLRKQVVAAVSERLSHLSQLAQLDAALRHGADAQTLAKMVDSWFEQAGLVRVEDANHPEREVIYDVVSDEGGAYEVTDPAYVDSGTGRLIRAGRARRAPVARPAPRSAPVEEPAEDLGDLDLADEPLASAARHREEEA